MERRGRIQCNVNIPVMTRIKDPKINHVYEITTALAGALSAVPGTAESRSKQVGQMGQVPPSSILTSNSC